MESSPVLWVLTGKLRCRVDEGLAQGHARGDLGRDPGSPVPCCHARPRCPTRLPQATMFRTRSGPGTMWGTGEAPVGQSKKSLPGPGHGLDIGRTLRAIPGSPRREQAAASLGVPWEPGLWASWGSGGSQPQHSGCHRLPKVRRAACQGPRRPPHCPATGHFLSVFQPLPVPTQLPSGARHPSLSPLSPAVLGPREESCMNGPL